MRWAEIWAAMFEQVGNLEKCRKQVENTKFSEWAPLVGEMFAHLVRVFWRYLGAPSSDIRKTFFANISRIFPLTPISRCWALYRSEGLPERDISSLCVMGWGVEDVWEFFRRRLPRRSAP